MPSENSSNRTSWSLYEAHDLLSLLGTNHSPSSDAIATADGGLVETETGFDFSTVVFDTGAGSVTLPARQNAVVYASIGMNYSKILSGEHPCPYKCSDRS
ncbi:hypothetical protein Cob_v001780 [Colletotrichum orbiculare MAFF 240422]|uniref:Uncharacterized protein n=1 Tax=Colletotrichum orbiculare (strain 104-T / ATCC 96160 / CBS 514.97 / LARS 414 / MAFF 240422) TaxID=1213857 RepID=A0A484G533_COLOR|nr:hypothetical protein Cob_v001780 [Colletotrichum orbiculare MAFF 240422]